MKMLSLAATAASLLATGCGQAPPPAADPAQLARALAALQEQESDAAARFQERLAGADRLSTTLSKIDPARLNPEAAAALLQ
jgi:hypothetical protein